MISWEILLGIYGITIIGKILIIEKWKYDIKQKKDVRIYKEYK